MGLFNLFKGKEPKVIIRHNRVIQQNIDNYSPENNYKQDRINYKSLPESHGLIADVVMLYNFQNNPVIISNNINDYVQYFVYRYNVNPIKLANRLLNEGYLSVGLTNYNLTQFLNSLTIPDLKNILVEKGLKPTGKKEKLVNTIIANYSISELKELFPFVDKLSFVTNKGDTLIKGNNDLIQLHRFYSEYLIEYDEYSKVKEKYNPDNFFYICISVFNKRTIENTLKKDWGILRCNYFNLYNAYINLDDIDNACRYLVKSIYIDLSGMSNSNTVSKLNSSSLCLSKFLLKIKEAYKYEYLLECSDIPLPFTYFDLNTTKQIFEDILNDDISLDNYNKLQKKPKENNPNYSYHNYNFL